jgi:glycyl-tRNA synthetase beta chain
MKPLLIEIGSEEIPARFIPRGLSLLRESLVELLEKSSIDYENVHEFATPRRLSIYIDNVAEKQSDKTVEFLGPPKKIAFDENGNPTKAALGFAKSLNVDVGVLKIKETERGEYVAAKMDVKGKPAADVLAAALPGLISSLQIPKAMRWGDSSLKYFRPIRWLLAILGSDIIPFELDGMKSSNISYGHRFLSPAAIKIDTPSSYLQLLKQNHVLADPGERKSSIMAGVKSIESSARYNVHEDSELLDTVTNLVEYPTVLSGSFDDKYTSLPKELLITVMKSHQKYFSVEDKDGNMLPSFIVVSNTKTDNNETVRIGAERVLRARLEDAQFYYVEDQKKPLGEYIKELKKVTFQEKLGSIHKKAERVASLCTFISDTLHLNRGEELLRAAMLCKTDLVTGVVGEFPELQGYIGMIYALNSGEDREIASAIYEHYLPRSAGDILPSGEVGSILSISDKMDNIASFFYLGMIPTGSEDPFALRRQAAGIINILQSNDINISLNLIISKSLQNLECSEEERKKLTDQILQFIRQRLEGMFLSEGYSHDIINAASSLAEMNITNVRQRILSLVDLKKEDTFPSLLMAAKRVYNILSKVQPGDVHESLLTEPSEKNLLSTARAVHAEVKEGEFNALFKLEQPINSFFDNVLVMDKNPAIKDNRLALLLSVKMIFDNLGDFSKIVE